MTTCGDNGGRTLSGANCRRPVRGGARCAAHAADDAAGPRPGAGAAVPFWDERDFKTLLGGAVSLYLRLRRHPRTASAFLILCGVGMIAFALVESESARSIGKGWGVPTKADMAASRQQAELVDFLVAVRHDPMLHRELHVNRTVESELRALAGVPDIQYVVVFGARGCGKTQAVLGATEGVAGVLHIRVSNTNTGLMRLIAAELPGEAPVMSVNELARLFAKAGDRLNEMGGSARVPTLVVEVESGTRGDVVYNLFHEIKLLSSDSKVCRVITVLSDATAVYSLPADVARQLKVFVDDLTEAEAHAMLAKRGVANETRRAALIEAVGTRASSLDAVIKWQDDAEALRAYVADTEEEAYQQLKKLAIDETDGVAVRSVFRCIVEATSEPLQVRLNDLPAAALQLSVPANVAQLMKARDAHVLLYHPAERAYRFLTIFHERAAARVLSEAAPEVPHRLALGGSDNAPPKVLVGAPGQPI
uniref:Uncharacterized protein n=1 Tax=Bicosoecida sp. CB-2014 TaxID=1486930 RepID=A0A7S1G8E3_9STRA|mmetsp:Transcript_2116/g.6882  ORF Transcript_2116/g.6882 Transcript_2116/m.6882 type:complete len:478 (+) Transcript_2116:430-1863(+)